MKDIEILKFSEDGTKSEFTIKAPLSFVSSRNGLAQRIIKIMFTQIGSDTYSKESGTIFYELLKLYREDEIDTVRNMFPIIVKNLEEQIKKEQTLDVMSGYLLSNDELLESLVLRNYVWDAVFGGWILTIEVITKNGNQTFIQIP